MRYFMYMRKSTDEEDRQVLSLEAQETELREFAQKENLVIAEIFSESRTAKAPGRPVFNDMISRLEAGEADGLICWHPDRLARNSIDGGKIIFLVDTGIIKGLKCPSFWFEPTPQGKFMLNIAFGQSKYFVDNLSENTKRGLRQKVRRGEWPSVAPLGYLNDRNTRTVVRDETRFELVKKMFELYSTEDFTLQRLSDVMFEVGLFSKFRNPLAISSIHRMLTNPFYCGMFVYNEELHQGKHEPMITKKLFDEVQISLKVNAKLQKRMKQNFAFRSLFTCGECGGFITAEAQRGHTYYRCTKKKQGPDGLIRCSQKYIREEKLEKQINRVIKKVSLSEDWTNTFMFLINERIEQNRRKIAGLVSNLETDVSELDNLLEKLLDSKLAGQIDLQEYMAKKQKILEQKARITDKIFDLKQDPYHWLEQVKKFILTCKQAHDIALQKNLFEKRDFLKSICSNRKMLGQKINLKLNQPFKILANFRRSMNKVEPQNVPREYLLREWNSNTIESKLNMI